MSEEHRSKNIDRLVQSTEDAVDLLLATGKFRSIIILINDLIFYDEKSFFKKTI